MKTITTACVNHKGGTKLTLAQDLEAPVEAGQKVGELEILVNGETRDTLAIISRQEVQRLTTGGIFQRMLRGLLMAEQR